MDLRSFFGGGAAAASGAGKPKPKATAAKANKSPPKVKSPALDESKTSV
jgi:hypothetical protein